ncbi:MAG: VTT domain-containing protein [Micrococcales bacterium]|nr:VTT domain-containing protein [Micrococcales bacterium]
MLQVASDTITLALGPSWLDPAELISRFVGWLGPWALVGVCVVVFAETGLMVGFFLPGDSLLFTLGVFVGAGTISVPLWAACLAVALCAVAGAQSGYWIGRLVGPKLFTRDNSRVFKPSHIEKTNAYFTRYGGRTIVIAQYVPIVRAFAPPVAGAGKMNYRHFCAFNVVAAFTWGVLLPIAGYWLGRFAWVGNNIDLIIIAIVLVSIVPMVVEYFRHKRNKPSEPAA